MRIVRRHCPREYGTIVLTFASDEKGGKMQDGNDCGSRSKGTEEPKTGVPPVVGHRERDNTVVITHTAEDAHAEQPAGGNSTDSAREQGGPDERLKK